MYHILLLISGSSVLVWLEWWSGNV